jgi:dolichol-phosphate mannosyltransferase
VIPTYNEADNILSLIDEIFASIPAKYSSYVLVVDDSSPDGTAVRVKERLSQDVRVQLLVRKEKKGLGSAYLDGFRRLQGSVDPDFFVQIDADFSHPPRFLGPLVDSAANGECVSVGSRRVPGGGIIGWPVRRVIVSDIANLLATFFLRLRVKDFTSGFRCLPKRAVQALLMRKMASSGYDYQIESLWRYSRSGICIREVPFIYRARRRGATKLSSRDIVRFLITTMRIALRG